MKSLLLKFSAIVLTLSLSSLSDTKQNEKKQSFQGKAYYLSKAKMNLGTWGARLSEGQKKEIEARLKNRLQKSYVLTFNKEESFFSEEDQLDAMSGATDSWGKNFAPGDQYKNVKTNSQIQNQEFYGKNFLVNDNLQPIEWVLGKETKQIGDYMCFKATASIPTNELTWFNFSWSKLRDSNPKETDTIQAESKAVEIAMTEVEAWYTPQIPVSHGPMEYWGLPGLILEVSAGETTMLCSKIVMNPEEKMEIKAPEKGTQVTKMEYQEIISKKMKEFRDNRSGRRRG
ncbi:GLPGLI family protein [Winogradskyella sp. F6397]|uniref:GLPGLI family protein n=1 Tax=Winogradskyella marina TaxID=2785530 RepID=A0ABS0EIC5_9FLAO|nr:GLPGLI family protein [Winogradskyella marina]MBF8150214.1 GLPGLI family protein [Winogradskyella marina]